MSFDIPVKHCDYNFDSTASAQGSGLAGCPLSKVHVEYDRAGGSLNSHDDEPA